LPVFTVFIATEDDTGVVVVIIVVGVEAGGGGGVPVPLLALSDRLMSESSDACEIRM